MVNLRDSYKFYINNSEESKVDINVYLKIVYGYIKFIMNKVFEGNDVKLSVNNSLGTLCIRGTKTRPRLEDGKIKGLAPDWAKTSKLWSENEEAKNNKEIIYLFNEHSNGIRYRITWLRKDIKIANNKLYSLIFTKGPSGNKRKLSSLIKQDNKEYIVIK